MSQRKTAYCCNINSVSILLQRTCCIGKSCIYLIIILVNTLTEETSPYRSHDYFSPFFRGIAHPLYKMVCISMVSPGNIVVLNIAFKRCCNVS